MKAGIVGVGKAGSFHLKALRRLKVIKNIYPVDIDPQKLSQYKKEGEEAFSDYKNLKGKVDFVVIATPTSIHFEVARFFLDNKIPVLVEKPLANSLTEADKLISLSQKNKTLLFVGHIERYNNAYIYTKNLIKNPEFIECHRLSMYPYRSLDISVVLDLMIHDLDIILDITKDKVKKIDAVGVKVLSGYEDIANARITFQKGCIANVTASRVSKEQVRKFRVFSSNAYISIDYATQEVEIYQKIKDEIRKKVLRIQKEEPLKKELDEFINLVKKRALSYSSSQKARDALALALKIQALIKKNK